jgi:hypothetical protein
MEKMLEITLYPFSNFAAVCHFPTLVIIFTLIISWEVIFRHHLRFSYHISLVTYGKHDNSLTHEEGKFIPRPFYIWGSWHLRKWCQMIGPCYLTWRGTVVIKTQPLPFFFFFVLYYDDLRSQHEKIHKEMLLGNLVEYIPCLLLC